MTVSRTLDRVRSWLSSRALTFKEWTWRVEVKGYDGFEKLIENGDRIMICFWHGKYVPILPLMRGNSGVVFTSASKNGGLIAGVCSDFGFSCVQIPDRGGRKSLSIMEAALVRNRLAGVAVDGPLGPYHQVKEGVVLLASKLGFYLLPVSVGARNKLIMKKRWDLMEIPFPFTRVCLVIGDPIAVPPSPGPDQIEACSAQLRETLESLDTAAVETASGN